MNRIRIRIESDTVSGYSRKSSWCYTSKSVVWFSYDSVSFPKVIINLIKNSPSVCEPSNPEWQLLLDSSLSEEDIAEDDHDMHSLYIIQNMNRSNMQNYS
jgi:hypothetical protein